MLPEILEKIKGLWENNQTALLVGAVFVLAGAGSFGLGRLSLITPKKEPIRLQDIPKPVSRPIPATPTPFISPSGAAFVGSAVAKHPIPPVTATPLPQGKYVGSKSGKTYHFPWCSGAKRIKEENKVWFATKEEAEAHGYHAAANCPGLTVNN